MEQTIQEFAVHFWYKNGTTCSCDHRHTPKYNPDGRNIDHFKLTCATLKNKQAIPLYTTDTRPPTTFKPNLSIIGGHPAKRVVFKCDECGEHFVRFKVNITQYFIQEESKPDRLFGFNKQTKNLLDEV